LKSLPRRSIRGDLDGGPDQQRQGGGDGEGDGDGEEGGLGDGDLAHRADAVVDRADVAGGAWFGGFEQGSVGLWLAINRLAVDQPTVACDECPVVGEGLAFGLFKRGMKTASGPRQTLRRTATKRAARILKSCT